MSEAAPTPAKKKGLNLVVILIPVAVIAALVLAFALPPTHALIVNGPLKPVFAEIGLAPADKAVVAKGAPLDPAAEVKRLGAQVDSERQAATQKDARIAELQTEVAGLKAPAAAAATAAPAPKPSPTGVSDDVKRAASYWAGMDADKAAELAQQLPPAYVKAVFRQMPTDAVAEILNALPAKLVAKLTAGSAADER